MEVQKYRKINRALFGVLLVTLGYSFRSGAALPAFLGFGFYLGLVSLLRLRVEGVLADERQVEVSEKAAQTSFRVLMPMLMLTSVALLVGGGERGFHYVKALGIVLSYVTCLGLAIYVLTYWYFDKKTGGR